MMAETVEIFEGGPRLGNAPGERFSGERAEPRHRLWYGVRDD